MYVCLYVCLYFNLFTSYHHPKSSVILTSLYSHPISWWNIHDCKHRSVLFSKCLVPEIAPSQVGYLKIHLLTKWVWQCVITPLHNLWGGIYGHHTLPAIFRRQRTNTRTSVNEVTAEELNRLSVDWLFMEVRQMLKPIFVTPPHLLKLYCFRFLMRSF